MNLNKKNFITNLKIQKAIEIKTNFKKIFKQNMNKFCELEKLELHINNWIKYDTFISGNIYLKNFNKYIIYQLNTLDQTVIKITDHLPQN